MLFVILLTILAPGVRSNDWKTISYLLFICQLFNTTSRDYERAIDKRMIKNPKKHQAIK